MQNTLKIVLHPPNPDWADTRQPEKGFGQGTPDLSRAPLRDRFARDHRVEFLFSLSPHSVYPLPTIPLYTTPSFLYLIDMTKETKNEKWTKIIDPRDPALLKPNSRARYEHPAYGGAITPTAPEGCHMWADYANDRWIAQEVE